MSLHLIKEITRFEYMENNELTKSKRNAKIYS